MKIEIKRDILAWNGRVLFVIPPLAAAIWFPPKLYLSGLEETTAVRGVFPARISE